MKEECTGDASMRRTDDSNRYKERLIEESPVGMYVCDAAGYITFCNQVAISFLGTSPNYGTDHWSDFWQIYQTDGRQLLAEHTTVAKVLDRQSSTIAYEELLVKRLDTRIFHLLFITRAILTDEGIFDGCHITTVDISHKLDIDTRESYLSAIVDSSDDAIISKNLNGIITSWNASAERIFGYKAQEVIGKSISILIPPSRLAEENLILSQIRKGKKVDHFQTVRKNKSGTQIPISLTVSPVKDADGKIIGASKIARDISKLVEAQKAVAQYTSKLETLHSLSRSISEKLNHRDILQKVTEATTQLTDAAFGAFFSTENHEENFLLYTSSGAGKEVFTHFSMPRNSQIFNSTFNGNRIIRSDDIRNDPRYDSNTPFNGLPGRYLPVVSYLAVPVVSANKVVIGCLFFGHPDAGKFTEQHENLVANIATQATVALDNSRLFEEVKELNARKDEFIALASHELKTPLTSLSGYLQLLEKKENDAVSKKFIEKALLQLGRLNKLVSDLLDVSKIEAGKLILERETFDMQPLIAEIIETFQYSNPGYKILFEAAAKPLPVVGDRHRIEQVMNNLLSNAIKYSPDANTIYISIEKRGKSIRVKVRDEGIGLTKRQQQKLFKRFYRAEGTDKIAGLGIGLYLSKEIISRHGGKIVVSSEYGEGSEFSFTLPCGHR